MIHSFIDQQYTQWISHVAIVEWGSYYPTENSCGTGSFSYATDHDRLLLTALPPVMRRLTGLHAVNAPLISALPHVTQVSPPL